MLDFGCGDGSFSPALFDPEALAVASGYGVYKSLICCDGKALPIPRGSVKSIYSNSVLEHVDDVEQVIKGLSDVLTPGGMLLLTVPVREFAAHVAAYFGAQESELPNRRMYH